MRQLHANMLRLSASKCGNFFTNNYHFLQFITLFCVKLRNKKKKNVKKCKIFCCEKIFPKLKKIIKIKILPEKLDFFGRQFF